MSTETVFRCLDSQVMDDYQANRAAVTAEFDAKVAAFKETIGDKELRGIQFFDGGWQVTGFDAGYRNTDLPAGWRMEQHSSNAVPAKRTPEGKAIYAELQTLYLVGNRYPGVPRHLHCEGFSIYPRVRKIDSTWWLTLSKTPYDKDLEGFDAALWERAKLSEYYAAVEEAEASK